MISTVFKNFTSFFDIRIPADNLKKIETFRSISGLYAKVHILLLVLLLVLSTKLFFKALMYIPLRKCI
jgi:hypothetical protein